ncbi:sir2 family histone, putative [Ichthyophthirius multifiliis]|uniref:Sir2 family histone, putative n=1 Tax=Ichthyophthirius multifiliis TaxID=5932 RepID=G0QYJ9_ICHMU|nr:sir2 family histone, putative [Ichthyophthirius multifiliis]EGR29706.1 sir2 family histone, putative [Ichthyophthirius multifiliis]|eukprot:XP_004030942.1 sir2 family histone, putative [Ichthyophthirius multifiliis]
MAMHFEESKHSIVFSFSDGSFWCYKCDTYITNIQLKCFTLKFSQIKHNEDFSKDEIQNIKKQLDKFKIDEKTKKFSRQKLVEGFQKKTFKNVVFLTGAGISVSAGIPDFRTPGTGLYSQLEKYNFPYPEAVFTLAYFRKNPLPFYKLAKEFLQCRAHFTINHYFMAKVYQQGALLANFTQNIDGLEIEAGIAKEKIIQAHGHFRSARCIDCSEKVEIEKLYLEIEKEEILKCEKCNGLIKPDIVFFGEQLPQEFIQKVKLLKQADLVIIMGTSLVVQPFSSLVEFIDSKVPLVLINRENNVVKDNNDSFLFIEGDLDNNVRLLLKDIGWECPDIDVKQPLQAQFVKNDKNEDIKQQNSDS